ncbi:hypothetical protein [Flavihumibacter sp. UBA7668]|uniref:hypothetical protein n=1 Tax=Flavihumibacter sp. UBA7668 TaxID=1946542 RepID=UPI0025BDD112|nr:hypothetical protein [Flavihumibacter sp. UBA7668]
MESSAGIRKLVLILLTGCFVTCLPHKSSQAQGRKNVQPKDTLIASIEFLKAEDGQLHFRAQYFSSKKEKTTLYVRDQDGELVFEDKLTGIQAQKIYAIPSACSRELVFEWVKPQRILIKKFKVFRSETSYVTVSRMN